MKINNLEDSCTKMETAHGLEKCWSGTNQVLRKLN